MKNRKEKTGIVISDKMNKSITVKITRHSPHSMYGKTITKFSKIKAHDEKNTAKIGDTVRIVETRPISKTKCWRLTEILGKK